MVDMKAWTANEERLLQELSNGETLQELSNDELHKINGGTWNSVFYSIYPMPIQITGQVYGALKKQGPPTDPPNPPNNPK